MKKLQILLLCLLCTSMYAQTNPVSDSAYLEVNNVKARFNANGNHFWNMTGTPEFEIPKGSSKTSLFSHTLWIGGKDANGQLKLAADRYGGNGKDFWPGPVSNSYGVSYDMKWNRIWEIDRATIEAHIDWVQNPSQYPNYQIPAAILEWPAHGDPQLGQSFMLAPFHDYDNDGNYNPVYGDYPLIKGDYALWMVLNDTRDVHTETQGAQIGAEIELMAYGYDCPGCIHNTIYLEYSITNRSTYTLDETIIGFFTDFDLGYAHDDYVGCDVSRGAYYVYNGSAIDGNGLPHHYGANPPAQAIVVLKGVWENADGMDNPTHDYFGNQMCDESVNGWGYGDSIIDNEYSGLYGFMTLSNTAGGFPFVDPSNAAEYYRYLKLHTPNDTALRYGGNASLASGAENLACRYMFPGDTDPVHYGTNGVAPTSTTPWTEGNVGNAPHDRRGLGVLKPFTFRPDQTETITLAMVWARDVNGSSVSAMQTAIDSVRYYFVKDKHPCASDIALDVPSTYELKQKAEFGIYPNPAYARLNIQLSVEEQGSYGIYDISGKRIAEGSLESGHLHSVFTGDLLNGVYFIRIVNGEDVYTRKFVKVQE